MTYKPKAAHMRHGILPQSPATHGGIIQAAGGIPNGTNPNRNSDIQFAPAQVTIQAEAAADSVPTFESIAYSGGKLFVAGFKHAVVVDLQGLEIGANVNILLDHKPSQRVGHPTTIDVSDTTIRASGVISAESQSANEVVKSAKKGFRWHFSIGARILAARELPKGRTRVINGRTIHGPAIVATQSKLNEISFVGIGGDEANQVRIAAESGADAMNFQEWLKKQGFIEAELSDDQLSTLKAAYAAEGSNGDDVATTTMRESRSEELKRIGEIEKLAANGHSEICAEGIAEGWSVAEVEVKILRAERDTSTGGTGERGPAIHAAQRPTDDNVLAAAMLLRCNYDTMVEQEYGPRVAERANAMRRMSFPDFCRASLQNHGHQVPVDRNDMIRAALSHNSISTIVGNAANKSMVSAYQMAPATWRSFAAVKTANDFKTHNALGVEAVGDLEEVTEGGEIRHADVTERVYPYQVGQYAKMVRLGRKNIINDDLSLLDEVGPRLGQSAARAVSDHVWTQIMANPGSHWAAGNSNFLDAPDADLQLSSLSAAINLLRSQTDANDSNLDLVPQTLVVSPQLETTARQLLESMELARVSTGDQLPSGNPMRQVASLEIEPRLSNTTKFANADADSWYLFSAPSNTSWIVAFLGRQVPQLEFEGLRQGDFNTLTVAWRTIFDFGTAAGDPVASVKSTGDAT